MQRWAKTNNIFHNGSPYHVPDFNKMTMRSHVEKSKKNTMEMGVRKIVIKLGKVYLKN